MSKVRDGAGHRLVTTYLTVAGYTFSITSVPGLPDDEILLTSWMKRGEVSELVDSLRVVGVGRKDGI